jgi:hypothetical protein
MRYQQFASNAYCGAVGQVFKIASQQEKAFCVLCFEVSRSVITGQREFADGVRFTRVRLEIDFLLTFETTPFFCERTVYDRQF